MNAKKLILILALLVVVLGGTTFYFYTNSKLLQGDNSKADLAEAKALAEKVGKLIVLPTDEVPTIATVSDPEALQNQSFFAEAKKGDKVLIYTNARKAILYDLVANKIVNVAPLNIGEEKTQKSTSQFNVTTPPEKKSGF
ncbi:MAG: hypothetical protein Q8O46_04865 [bacterium]|nr:hypothetical protein [bacterium]